MWRHLASGGLILILGGVLARADTIDMSVSGLTTTYTPGSTLTLEVGLTGATNLNAYNVGLDLNSSNGTAGTDFYFEGSPSTDRPPDGANSYVFDSALGVSSPFGFVATPGTLPGTNTATLNLSDFLATGQSVQDAGSSTLLATVVIGTTPTAGNLTLRFDGNLLELLDPNLNPVSGFSYLQTNLESFNPPTVIAQTPEPSTRALFAAGAIGLLGYGLRRRVSRRTATPAAFDQQDSDPPILSIPSHSYHATNAARRAA